MLFFNTMIEEVMTRVRANKPVSALWVICAWLVMCGSLLLVAGGVVLIMFLVLRMAFASHFFYGLLVTGGLTSVIWVTGLSAQKLGQLIGRGAGNKFAEDIVQESAAQS